MRIVGNQMGIKGPQSGIDGNQDISIRGVMGIIEIQYTAIPVSGIF